MATLIQTLPDGSTISFDQGGFDAWCVYVQRPGETRKAPKDSQYFAAMLELGNTHGCQHLYNDFVVIYNQTTSDIDPKILDLILQISEKYGNDSLEIAILFTVIYAGMIAEENKTGAILKKRIKHLGMYQTLMKILTPEEAANFSRGKKWRALDIICKEYGF